MSASLTDFKFLEKMYDVIDYVEILEEKDNIVDKPYAFLEKLPFILLMIDISEINYKLMDLLKKKKYPIEYTVY